MDRSQTSYEILSHFDRPKTVDMPEFEGVEQLLSDVTPDVMSGYFASSPPSADETLKLPRNRTRGVRWVLEWAAAVAVLGVATNVLAEFVYVVAAEHTLTIAARAGAMEATLPRATCESVIATIKRRLAGYPRLIEQLHVSLLQNGSLVQQRLTQKDSDCFAVMLWAPKNSAVPNWLKAVTFWGTDSRIQTQAEHRVPGRKLAFSAGPMFGAGVAFGAGLSTPPMR